MQKLTFSTCNSGHKDVFNLAYSFKIKMSIEQYIVAWDGGTFFDYNEKNLKKELEHNQHGKNMLRKHGMDGQHEKEWDVG